MKKYIIFSILSVFLIFLLVGCVSNHKVVKQNTNQPIVGNVNTDTSTWKTYVNNQYDFTISYPVSWKECPPIFNIEYDEGANNLWQINHADTCGNYVGYPSPDSLSITELPEIYKVFPTYESLKEAIGTSLTPNKQGQWTGGVPKATGGYYLFYIDSLKEDTIGGQPALEVGQCLSIQCEDSAVNYLIYYQNKLFAISYYSGDGSGITKEGQQILSTFKFNNQPVVGGDRDAHGCIGSAGYSWCEVKQKCLRPWEEKCEAVSKSIDIQQDTLYYLTYGSKPTLLINNQFYQPTDNGFATYPETINQNAISSLSLIKVMNAPNIKSVVGFMASEKLAIFTIETTTNGLYKTYLYGFSNNYVSTLTLLNEETRKRQIANDKYISIPSALSDNNYIAFDMYNCLECDGNGIDTDIIIMDIQKNIIKSIGPIVDGSFKWLENGQFEYKKSTVFNEDECSKRTDCSLDECAFGACPKDPKTIPIIKGTWN